MYADGGNLYLQVKRITEASEWRVSKAWVFRYHHEGRRRTMGLGAFPMVGLAEARDRAERHRKELDNAKKGYGDHPLEIRRKRKQQIRPTFTFCCKQYLETHASQWSSKKHAKQWRSTLKTYAEPVIGELLVDDISIDEVEEVLRPIWHTKHETAKRTRQRMATIFEWAQAKKYLHGDNPAELTRGLRIILGTPNKQAVEVKHHTALPYKDAPGFYAELTAKTSISARALAFTILTAARTSETRLMRAVEVNGNEWVIPGERMKAGREHRVHLTQPARDLLKFEVDGWLWPGMRGGGMSNMAMLKLCRTMRPGVTVHGFRSTFRDLVAEETDVDGDIAELCLAHTVGSEVERAYRRSELLDKRRDLLELWAAFVTGD